MIWSLQTKKRGKLLSLEENKSKQFSTIVYSGSNHWRFSRGSRLLLGWNPKKKHSFWHAVQVTKKITDHLRERSMVAGNHKRVTQSLSTVSVSSQATYGGGLARVRPRLRAPPWSAGRREQGGERGSSGTNGVAVPRRPGVSILKQERRRGTGEKGCLKHGRTGPPAKVRPTAWQCSAHPARPVES
jgi:hypothetical protein